jgi:hypothetical protein
MLVFCAICCEPRLAVLPSEVDRIAGTITDGGIDVSSPCLLALLDCRMDLDYPVLVDDVEASRTYLRDLGISLERSILKGRFFIHHLP